MNNNNFLQTNGVFNLNTLKCLRSEYYHNNCQLCFAMCQSDAIGLVRGKINLFEQKCINCGDCLGICPTEALSLETFDANDFVLKFCDSKKDTIVDKVDVASIGALDEHHLLSIVLRTAKDLKIVCENSFLFDYLQAKIENSNKFLQDIKSQNKIIFESSKDHSQNQRRNLFKILNNFKSELQKDEKTSRVINENQKLIPSKKILFKNTLKTLDIDFESCIATNDFIKNKSISYDDCTNCGDCITFCPTEAFFSGSAKKDIYFNAGKCIGCGICVAVCKPKAIIKLDSIRLLDFAFDRASKQVEFEYEVCEECKVSFVYKGGEKICARCEEFKDDFKDMFVMAKDM